MGSPALTSEARSTKGAATRDQILNAAARLMHVQGYQSTSLDDVLRESGVGKGNFYYYFKSKEELGYAIIDRTIRAFVDRTLGPAFADLEADPVAQIDAFLDRVLEAQRQTYGDGLDGAVLHPKMWSVKGHYYGPTFYNYPYTFGLLFGLGLYARYSADPDAFRAGYDDLLSSTGLADAATLAGRFGFDDRGIAFWRSSLDIVRRQIGEFERLV